MEDWERRTGLGMWGEINNNQDTEAASAYQQMTGLRNVVHTHNGPGYKEEQNTVCDNMDGPGGIMHSEVCRTERQASYELT